MSILSWGKCVITHAISTNGAPAGDATWTVMDTPKEDTTKVTPTAGKKLTAAEEGGELVDVKYGKNNYVLEFDLFVKKGKERPFVDDDGIITGEYAFRVIPEDNTCEGCQIDRASIHVEERFSTAEGIMLHYVADVLKPATGKKVKSYTVGT